MSDTLSILLRNYHEAIQGVFGENLKNFEMQYGMEINPSVQCVHTYNQWKNVYPFFMNIEKDGVSV